MTKPKGVQRWTYVDCCGDADMVTDENGEFVRLADHEQEVERRVREADKVAYSKGMHDAMIFALSLTQVTVDGLEKVKKKAKDEVRELESIKAKVLEEIHDKD